MPIFIETFDFGAIFDFQDFQQVNLWTEFSATNAPKEQESEWPEAFLKQPCAPRLRKTIWNLIFIDLEMILDRVWLDFGCIRRPLLAGRRPRVSLIKISSRRTSGRTTRARRIGFCRKD